MHVSLTAPTGDPILTLVISKLTATDSASLAVVSAPSAVAVAALTEAADAARGFARASVADNTRRAYRSDLDAFATWARPFGFETLPSTPETVALFLAESARALKAATVTRRAAAIASAHRAAGFPSPTEAESVRRVLRGVRTTLGTRPERKSAATLREVRAMLATLPDDIGGKRDRALVLLGFFLAARRSELADLRADDVTTCREGLRIIIRRSKTDREGEGAEVPVPYHADPDVCPVRALAAWKEAADIADGKLFRRVDRWGHVAADGITGEAVAIVVKRAAEDAGLDADAFAGHSLRSGFITAAAEAGAPLDVIMTTSRHRSHAVALGYVRRANLFHGCAATFIR